MTFDDFLMRITDLGDSGLLTALLLAGVLHLLARGNKVAALALLTAFFTAVFGIGLVKLLFLGCASEFRQMGIRSPSGHTTLSMAIYGTYGVLLAKSLPRYGWMAAAGGISLALAIAFSRVWLHFHSAPEVAIGLLIGSCAVMLSWGCILRSQFVAPLGIGRLLCWFALAGFALYGFRLPAEPLIGALARMIRGYNPLC